MGHKVLTKLTTGLDYKRHVIEADNFFSSVILFQNFERHGIYATRTTSSNCIGFLFSLKNAKKLKNKAQGDLNWMMRDSRKMYFVLWKDEQFVLLLSICTPPIIQEDPMSCMVPRRDGANCLLILISPMLLEYTKKSKVLM